MVVALMWDRFYIHLWCLGCGRKNLWFEGLSQRLLNAINARPMTFEESILFHLKLVLNRRVGHYVSDLLLLVVKSTSFSLLS